MAFPKLGRVSRTTSWNGLVLLAFTAALLASSDRAYADMRWYRDLVNKPNASLEDAVHVIHILAAGKDDSGLRYEDRLVFLVRRGIVDLDWDLDADRSVTCGELAFMACKTLGLSGGLSMFVFGTNVRYAYRECVALEFVGPLGEEQYLSGEELLTFLRKARQFQETQGKKS